MNSKNFDIKLKISNCHLKIDNEKIINSKKIEWIFILEQLLINITINLNINFTKFFDYRIILLKIVYKLKLKLYDFFN